MALFDKVGIIHGELHLGNDNLILNEKNERDGKRPEKVGKIGRMHARVTWKERYRTTMDESGRAKSSPHPSQKGPCPPPLVVVGEFGKMEFRSWESGYQE